MAQVNTSHGHRGALGDAGNSRINAQHNEYQPEYCTLSTSENFIEVCSMQEKKLEQFLGSPYKPRSILLDANTMEEFSHQSSGSPSNPPKANGSSRSRGGPFAQKLVAIAHGSLEELCDLPVEEKNCDLTPLLNKELPQTPKLEHNGPTYQWDSGDNTTINLDKAYPPLQPIPSANATKYIVATPASADSFKVAPSLSTLSPGRSPEIEVGVANAVEFRQIRATLIEDRRSPQPGRYSLPAPPNNGSVAQLGLTPTHKNGSPIHRKKLPNPHAIRGRDALTAKGKAFVSEAIRKSVEKKEMQRFEQNERDEQESLIGAIDESRILEPVQEPDSDDHAEPLDSEKQESALRRSAKYGTGPTLRFAYDAEEVIMGSGHPRSEMSSGSDQKGYGQLKSPQGPKVSPIAPPMPRKSSLRKHDGASKVDSTPKIVIHRSTNSFTRTDIGPSGTPFGPRKSSLPSSPEYIPFEKGIKPSTTQASFVDRLSRPTRASQARTSESQTHILEREKANSTAGTPTPNKSPPQAQVAKSKVTGRGLGSLRTNSTNTFSRTKPVKAAAMGFKNRVTAMLGGRRRTTIAPSVSAPPISTIDKNPLDDGSERRSEHQNTINNEDKGVSRNPLDTVRENGSGEIFEYDPVDKAANEATNSRQRRQFLQEAHEAATYDAFHPHNINRVRRSQAPGDDDDPSTPPGFAGGPAGHYDEEELTLEEGVGEILGRIIQDAIAHYHHVAEIAANTTDPVAREAIAAILTPLANSIHATRRAMITAIALGDALERLASWTLLANDRAARIASVTATGNVPARRRANPHN